MVTIITAIITREIRRYLARSFYDETEPKIFTCDL